MGPSPPRATGSWTFAPSCASGKILCVLARRRVFQDAYDLFDWLERYMEARTELSEHTRGHLRIELERRIAALLDEMRRTYEEAKFDRSLIWEGAWRPT
ncbi:hypothetical protein N7517_004727 [Penicillium concentricum]|uniref:Uncharacterized protein n=1 Tax=Penicillium concentricum TaxID=293559 RepID=A0A9W9S644_9EURO|nr:uncharacterized protein N7517_004727 [Penicillium concentricum]KAJ5372721.1 hypothetical protein N7517_004727 [Penicillium concentricum]